MEESPAAAAALSSPLPDLSRTSSPAWTSVVGIGFPEWSRLLSFQAEPHFSGALPSSPLQPVCEVGELRNPRTISNLKLIR